MSAVLNTNVASLRASNNLLEAQSKMADSVERLSSGLRINRARDDAAGLGVSNSLTAQINGANQGIRNLNDGISMVQTAEAAIAAASDMGQRILTLATQGANSTWSIDERKSIQAEMAKLLDAMDAIGKRTKFSGNALLGVGLSETESTTKYSLQISRETDDKVNLTNGAFRNIGFATTAATEVVTFSLSSAYTNGQVVQITDGTVTRTVTVGNLGATREQMGAALAGGADVANVTTTTQTGVFANSWTATAYAANSNVNTFTATGAGRTSVNVADLTVGAGAGNPGIVIQSTTQGATAADAQASTLKTKVDELSVLLAAGTPNLTNIATKFNEIQTASQSYVVALGTQRSLLGAFQNQIEYTVSNVTELSGNLSAARSRVQDTDYAAETANLTKGQILQQAATAMLAQANQMPNVILTLLK
jgi:flagellin